MDSPPGPRGGRLLNHAQHSCLQHRGREGRRGVDRPGRLRRRGQQAAPPRRRPDAPGEPPRRHRQHPGPGRRRRLGQEALPPEGHGQRPRRVEADEQAEGRRRRLRPPQPRLQLLAAEEGDPHRHPDGDPLEVPGRPGDRPRRPGPRRDAQDQALRPGPPRITRPDLKEHEVETTGETKAAARKRTLDGRTILLGIPDHNPTIHRSARNIEGVEVAPVAEFNTYDVLKHATSS